MSTTEVPTPNSPIADITFDGIVRQFHGGEHRLAGMRASEMVYGSSKKANEKLLEKFTEKAPGIERYISAPESPVMLVDDQGGNPLATQPENDPEQLQASNMSSEKAKAEQKKVDDHLAPGRARREKAALSEDKNSVGTTKLNPAGSDKKPKKATKRASGPSSK